MIISGWSGHTILYESDGCESYLDLQGNISDGNYLGVGCNLEIAGKISDEINMEFRLARIWKKN